MTPEQKQLIREKLADIEHQRWAKWQAYEKLVKELKDGNK